MANDPDRLGDTVRAMAKLLQTQGEPVRFDVREGSTVYVFELRKISEFKLAASSASRSDKKRRDPVIILDEPNQEN